MMSANTPTPISQASRPPRCVRSASAVGEESRRRRGGALSWAASRPWPMSRRRSIRAATSSRASVASAGRSSTAGRAPANGRSSSAQPSGVAHRSQPADEVSATIRRSSATASTAPAIPVAMRRVGAIWLATAPTPTNTGSGETSAIERKTEGPGPARPARIPASSASHRRSLRPSRSPPSARRNTSARLTGAGRGRARGGRHPPRRAARAPPRAAPQPRRRSPKAPSRHDM